MAKKKEFALSRRELDIMNVLWAEGKPLKASDFPDRKPELSINTVQSVLKKLLQRGFIEVAEIVQSGTVLSRSYAPAIKPEEYAVNYVMTEIFPFDKMVLGTGYLSALFESVENDEMLMEELEQFIKEKKSQ